MALLFQGEDKSGKRQVSKKDSKAKVVCVYWFQLQLINVFQKLINYGNFLVIYFGVMVMMCFMFKSMIYLKQN